MSGATIIVALLAVAMMLAPFVHRRSKAPSPPSPWERLVHVCLGDRRQAKRLVKLEQAKQPGLSRREAIERALDALHRDNA
jgi:hypothetical protein